jgi:hypothetical protein
MAIPISKQEFMEDLEKRKEAAALMPGEARICPVCYAIFSEGNDRDGWRVCWCDYESDWRESAP